MQLKLQRQNDTLMNVKESAKESVKENVKESGKANVNVKGKGNGKDYMK